MYPVAPGEPVTLLLGGVEGKQSYSEVCGTLRDSPGSGTQVFGACCRTIIPHLPLLLLHLTGLGVISSLDYYSSL